MRALVVGAGAVGQVFARHLALGGAEVTFLVREKYAAECRAGFTMYPLNRARRVRTTPERFEGAAVVTGPDQVAAGRWDQVYVTVSSAALRGAWFEALARAIGDATLVLLQPGPDDRDYALAHVPAERLVQGVISLVSYAAPLPGETRFPGPGMAYWFPPAPSPFSGPTARRDQVVSALKAGGMPAARHADVARVVDFPNAGSMPLLLHLEASGWSFARALREDRRGLEQALAAGRQAMAVVAKRSDRRVPLALRLGLRGLTLRLGAALARFVVPFDLETYVRAHFTKVADQTRLIVARFVALGRERGLPVDQLVALANEPAADAAEARLAAP
jgi:2-dehydropantoate 2-reductase